VGRSPVRYLLSVRVILRYLDCVGAGHPPGDPRAIDSIVRDFSPYLYRAHNMVERFFNKIKQCRRVATRFDKLAACVLMSARPNRIVTSE
jgi:transposase